MKIDIDTTEDYYDCETCGGSYACGGTVRIDGKPVLERIPSAYCYDSPSFSESDLLVMALKKVGIEVYVDGEKFFISSHDDEYHGTEETKDE